MIANLSHLHVLYFLVTACNVFVAGQSPGHGIEARQETDPDAVTNPQDFYLRAYHASIVLGHYLYIDGGEIQFYVGGGNTTNLPENSTYSIDLSTSWTNQTVSLNRIVKQAPVLNLASLWADASSASFYSYGGEISDAIPYYELPSPPPNALWQFTPAGSGGSWSVVTNLANSIFPTLQRTTDQAGAYGNGVGYSLGGIENWRTNFPGIDSDIPAPGMVSYNMTSMLWTNITAAGLTNSNTSMSGQLQFVPNFGPNGLLFALGGQTSTNVQWYEGQNLLPFNTVSIFEPTEGMWHSQTVGGPADAIPPARERFCSVGIPGDNGTFEIFIYGGTSTGTYGIPSPSNDTDSIGVQQNLALDAVYVLSLPSFSWHKAAYTPAHPRTLHTCNVVGHRQMVVVGGLNPNVINLVPDIWPQGLGIFDLSAMEWKSQYDASAPAYVTPDVVKSWYKQNGRYPASWDDPVVKSWFIDASTNTSTNANPSSSSHSSTGAIIGGVVGGVVGLLLIGALTWFLIRRRRPRTAVMEKEMRPGEEYHKPELDASGNRVPSYSNQPPVELPVIGNIHPSTELLNSQRPGSVGSIPRRKPVAPSGSAEMP